MLVLLERSDSRTAAQRHKGNGHVTAPTTVTTATTLNISVFDTWEASARERVYRYCKALLNGWTEKQIISAEDSVLDSVLTRHPVSPPSPRPPLSIT